MADFYLDLAEQVSSELEACIGCHLCLQACPLPEVGGLRIGELNEGTAGGPLDGQLLAFTLACTQCGACVPVCPADLDRMRMMLAAKLRVEEPLPETPVDEYVGQAAAVSGWTIGSLAAHLARGPLFRSVEAARLRALVLQARLRRVPSGDIVIREGEWSTRLYVVVDGLVEASVLTADGRRQPLLTLGMGQFFGELGLLSQRPNPATVTALEESRVLEIPESALRRLMAEAAPVREALEALHAQRELGPALRRIELLAAVPDADLGWLVGRSRVRVYERGAVVAAQGTPTTTLHVVLSGFLKVSRRGSDGTDRTLTYLRDGGYLVDPALRAGGPRVATLTANTRCELVELGQPDLLSLLAARPAAGPAFEAAVAQDERLLQWALGPRPQPAAAEPARLLDEGILQAHSLLVIDRTRCVDCNNCVDACIRRHGHPRLERRGPLVGPYLVATACRQCDDPVCLLCPVDGIVRAPSGEIIITDECIGCGACAARCPYDSIRMADRRPAEAGGRRGPIDWLRGLIEPRERGAITFEHDDLRPKVAVKCDQCVGFKDGPACVRNCPTGAIFRTEGAALWPIGAGSPPEAQAGGRQDV